MTLSRRDFFKVAGLAIGGALASTETVLASSGETDPNEYAAMLYDATMCVGCNACTNACRAWNKTTDEPDSRQLYDAPKELSGGTWTLISCIKARMNIHLLNASVCTVLTRLV
jgi:Fe-S-cluster-containing dehydrogenase component